MAIMQEPDDELVPTHGLPMPVEAFEQLIDLVSRPYHYEMINGIVYNMAPPSEEHVMIARRITNLLEEQLGLGGPCRVTQEQRIAIPGHPSVQPDVFISCDRADWDKKQRARKNHRFHSPLIVVEVLSPSTEAYDRAEKFARYQLCPTLEVYILISQDKQQVEVYRRSNSWQMELFTKGQTVLLDQLDLELPLEEMYRGVF